MRDSIRVTRAAPANRAGAVRVEICMRTSTRRIALLLVPMLAACGSIPSTRKVLTRDKPAGPVAEAPPVAPSPAPPAPAPPPEAADPAEPPPPPPAPDPRCQPAGGVVLKVMQGDLSLGATSLPVATYTFYGSGAVTTQRDRSMPREACLEPGEVAALSARIRAATIGTTYHDVTCSAVNHTRWTVETPSTRAVWIAPCGHDRPTDDTVAVLECALDLAAGAGATRCSLR